jgi:hypothetical protein
MAITKLNNKAVANITTLPVALGDMVFISSQTASASASISFTTGIDSTYKEYVFYFVNIHPSVSDSVFGFNLSTDGGSNYNVTKTSTFFEALHNESGSSSVLRYTTLGSADGLAQSSNDQRLNQGTGNENDECVSGYLHVFNPSSTTFVKHYLSNTQNYYSTDYSVNVYVAGYGNTTSAINAIRFQMSSGNIDDGKILMFGIN